MPTAWLIGMTIIMVIIFFSIAWSIVQWSRNNTESMCSEEARVVAIDDRKSGMFVSSGRNSLFNLSREYHITFELLSNSERKKLHVPVDGHKTIAEGDEGVLTFQGTRYISFKRHQAKQEEDSDSSDSN